MSNGLNLSDRFTLLFSLIAYMRKRVFFTLQLDSRIEPYTHNPFVYLR
jgi:hypothetical protein